MGPEVGAGGNEIEHIDSKNAKTRDIRALGAAHPPDINHGVIGPTLIVQIIQDPGNMRVAVVTTNIMHPLTVSLVCHFDSLVVVFFADALKIELDVLNS